MTENESLKQKLNYYLVPRIVKWLLQLVGLTCRKKWIGLERIHDLQESNRNFIYSLWHNNISLTSFLLKDQSILSMVSSSNDGRIAASVIELFGNTAIRGSNSRGGAKVLLAMIKGIKAGNTGAITPDGPRGPKFCLQQGAIFVAQKTKVPLVPLHIEATKQWIFTKSWDQHKFPKPFSTIVISMGSPFLIPEKLTKEQFDLITEQFKQQMMKNVSMAETVVNQLRNK